MSRVIIIYLPVLHQGYLQFLTKYADSDAVYILGEEILAQFEHLRKDIRAVKPAQMATAVAALGVVRKVEVLDLAGIEAISRSKVRVLMPDEDILHELADQFLTANAVEYDTVFLRWDKKNTVVQTEPTADEVISQAEFDQQMMQLAYDQADKSPDWWRRVGAVLVCDGKVVLTAHNHYVPDNQQAYYEGDPRGNFHKGVYVELGIAMHAEAEVICQAAAQGISTAGCTLYATTFPCPACAKLVAYSGIKKVLFSEGYSLVDGARVMKENGVELIKVQTIQK